MTRKDIAKDFLNLAAIGASRDAFAKYVAEKFIHHNAFFKGDRESLLLAMEEAGSKDPNSLFEIQHILEDGDLVAVHSRILKKIGPVEIAVMHIFKFDEDKIIELWDFGQSVPANRINENGMF